MRPIIDSLQPAATESNASIPVRFSYSSPAARTVSLALFFAERSARPAPGSLMNADRRGEQGYAMVRSLYPLKQVTAGMWQCEVPLTPGRHEYLFLVDGQWARDPETKEVCSDGEGSFNSVKTVGVAQPVAVQAVKTPQRNSSELRRAV